MCLFGFLLFSTQNLHAQKGGGKKDTVYYLLDTAAIPVKERMFVIEREGNAMVYILKCGCYPSATGIPFFYNIYRKKEEKINLEKFKKIKTVSLIQLIQIGVKCLAPSEEERYEFVFIEPDGKNMKLIGMTLGPPFNTRKVNTTQAIKPE